MNKNKKTLKNKILLVTLTLCILTMPCLANAEVIYDSDIWQIGPNWVLNNEPSVTPSVVPTVPPGPGPVSAYQVTVIVQDNGVAVEGATVRFGLNTYLATDVAGKTVFNGFYAGTYSLQVFVAGQEVYVSSVKVDGDCVFRVNLATPEATPNVSVEPSGTVTAPAIINFSGEFEFPLWMIVGGACFGFLFVVLLLRGKKR